LEGKGKGKGAEDGKGKGKGGVDGKGKGKGTDDGKGKGKGIDKGKGDIDGKGKGKGGSGARISTPTPPLPPVFPCPPPTATPIRTPTSSDTESETPVPTCLHETPVVPSTSPSVESCEIDVILTCTTDAGVPCKDLHTIPNGNVCAHGQSLFVITLQYEGETCSVRSNQQGDEANCTDLAEMEDEVKISCSDIDQPNTTTSLGEIVTVGYPALGFSLPDKLECRIFNVNDTLLQEVVIDTSGSVELNIGDRFGALRVADCSGPFCVPYATYTAVVTNIGASNLIVSNINTVEFDVYVDLADQLPSAVISPGNSVTVQFRGAINACAGTTNELPILVRGEPMNGGGNACEDAFCYTVTTTPQGMPQPTAEPTFENTRTCEL